MDYMILDSTGNALGAYDDEIAAHVALREIAAAAPGAADIALLAYVDGMPVGEALRPADLPLATYSVETSEWTVAALGRTRALIGWDQASRWCPYGTRPGEQLPSAVGVAAAPDWEEHLG